MPSDPVTVRFLKRFKNETRLTDNRTVEHGLGSADSQGSKLYVMQICTNSIGRSLKVEATNLSIELNLDCPEFFFFFFSFPREEEGVGPGLGGRLNELNEK